MAKKAISHQESGEFAGSAKNSLPSNPPVQSSPNNSATLPSAAPPLPLSPANESAVHAGKTDKGSVSSSSQESATQEAKKDLDFYKGVKESPSNKKYSVEAKPAEKNTSSKALKPASQTGTTKSELTKPKAVSSSKTSLSLQVAALRKMGDADQLMKKLRAAGYDVYLARPSANSSDQLIRVQVGPFSSEAEAAKVKAKLRQDGYSAITKR
jgi:cell division septation protein DedD